MQKAPQITVVFAAGPTAGVRPAALTQTICGPSWFDAALNLLGTVCDIDSGGVMPIGWHSSFRAH